MMRLSTKLSPYLKGALLLVPALVILPAQAAVWKVDPGHSTLGFTGTQTDSPFEGKFTRYTSDIQFDPAHLESSHIIVTVDVASATSGDQQRDEALPQKDWFNAAQFPKATFTTTSITSSGNKSYQAIGTLTLRGVTQPLTVPLTFDIQGGTAHITGKTKLNRTAFGVGQGQWSSGQWVGLDVTVNVDFTASSAG